MTHEPAGPLTGPGFGLADPGDVTVGATFRTGLYFVGIERPQPFRCRVEVVFDPRMLYCVAVEPPPPGGPPVSHDAVITSGRVAAAVEVPAQDGTPAHPPPGPVPLATLRWRCVGEGASEVFVRVVDPDGHAPSRLRIIQRPRA